MALRSDPKTVMVTVDGVTYEMSQFIIEWPGRTAVLRLKTTNEAKEPKRIPWRSIDLMLGKERYADSFGFDFDLNPGETRYLGKRAYTVAKDKYASGCRAALLIPQQIGDHVAMEFMLKRTVF